MFGIGGGELALIIIVLLLFVGPDKLPQVVKTVGTGLRDLRRAANMAQHELRQGMDELAREIDNITTDVRDAVDQAAVDDSDSATVKPAAPQDGDVLAEFRRRQAEERVRDESPPAWALKGASADGAADVGVPPRPTFNPPGSQPLQGTVARGGFSAPAQAVPQDSDPEPEFRSSDLSPVGPAAPPDKQEPPPA